MESIIQLIHANELWATVPPKKYELGPKIPKQIWDELGNVVSQNEKQPVMSADPT